MSDFGTVALGLGESLPVIGSAFAGMNQALQASHINVNRPQYQIPSNIGNNVAMYQNMADTSRMPGAGITDNAIYQNQASLVRAALQSGGSAGDILASLGGIGQTTNNSLNQVAQQGAQYQLQGKAGLAQANDVMADYKNQAFDYNQNQPYEQQLSKRMSLQGAALGNFNTTGQNLTSLGSLALGIPPGIGGLTGNKTNATYGGNTDDYGVDPNSIR
jgi:hypothetical protein